MSKKIIIGCKNQDNIVHFLKNDYCIVDPYIYNKNKEIIKNFDVCLLFDSTAEDQALLDLHNIPYLGHRRMGKYEQSLIFQSLNITTPETHKIVLDSNNSMRSDMLYYLIQNISDTEKFIVKAENGARGIGQALLNKNELYDIIDKCNNVNISSDDINNDFEIGAKNNFNSDVEKQYFRDIIISLDFLIQRKVNLVKEWRYIYFFNTDPIIIERNISDTWQANTSITGKGENILFSLKDKDHEIMNDYAIKLGQRLNSPFLSIDFYKDVDGNIGIFETQMQMGYSKVPKTELVTKTIYSVESWLKKMNY